MTYSDSLGARMNMRAVRNGSTSVTNRKSRKRKQFMPYRKPVVLLFTLLFFCYASVHQRPGWNQNSRLDLLHALFVDGTLRIDAYHGNTGDKSYQDGHYYSDKAPGIVILASPAFAISMAALSLSGVSLASP